MGKVFKKPITTMAFPWWRRWPIKLFGKRVKSNADGWTSVVYLLRGHYYVVDVEYRGK